MARVHVLTCAVVLGCSGPSHGELSRAATTKIEVTYVHQGPGPGALLFSDTSGNVVEERRAEPFGFEIEDADYRALDLGPLGQPVDSDTAWSFHGARWYEPESARWLSIDPPTRTPDAAKYMAAAWSLHPYQYVDQNPVLYWDPDGRDKQKQEITLARVADALRQAVKTAHQIQRVASFLRDTFEHTGIAARVEAAASVIVQEKVKAAAPKVETFVTKLLGLEDTTPK